MTDRELLTQTASEEARPFEGTCRHCGTTHTTYYNGFCGGCRALIIAAIRRLAGF